MAIRNSTAEWGSVSRFFHWAMALMFVVQYLAGEYDDFFGGSRFHVSFGLSLVGLALLRLVWRLNNPVPEAIAGSKRWERAAARAMHYSWYVLMFSLPLSGMVWRQASGKPLGFWGWFKLPVWLDKDKALAHNAHEIHELLGTIALILLALHLLAALKHHYLDHDATLRRMLGRE